MTLHDKIRQEGREEGREEGVEQGQRALLLKLLTLKFGAPADETRARVEQASVAELERWAAQILTANEIEQVWQ